MRGMAPTRITRLGLVNAYLVDLTLPPRDLVCPSTGGLFERFG